ncbi:hypothetical protein BDK51DRAFT_50870 [Blyttiomyces helicus]|uniref:GED domain-containing protein n=1 Tax=Blyttiomyces helicus TaxID=388810 RepID=A0A4P9W065_9FUNG|nr:hypothetical protein BDK51DRAFT_50870 [Blyttiomyces helicus]|eukprot:RKO83406.1 hypothetical protein BDK51DRAFT_50870 [Blyttiomyces helicus]
MLEAYWQISSSRLVDNVVGHVTTCIVHGFPTQLDFKVQALLSDDASVIAMSQEDHAVERRRAFLHSKIDGLLAVKEELAALELVAMLKMLNVEDVEEVDSQEINSLWIKFFNSTLLVGSLTENITPSFPSFSTRGFLLAAAAAVSAGGLLGPRNGFCPPLRAPVAAGEYPLKNDKLTRTSHLGSVSTSDRSRRRVGESDSFQRAWRWVSRRISWEPGSLDKEAGGLLFIFPEALLGHVPRRRYTLHQGVTIVFRSPRSIPQHLRIQVSIIERPPIPTRSLFALRLTSISVMSHNPTSNSPKLSYAQLVQKQQWPSPSPSQRIKPEQPSRPQHHSASKESASGHRSASSAAAPITPPQLPSSVSAPAPTLLVAVPELVTPVIVPVPDQPVAPIAAVVPVLLPADVPIRGSPYVPSMDPPTVVVQRSKVRIVNCDTEDAIVLNLRPDQDTVFDVKELILASTNWFENLQPSRICIFDKAKGQGKVDSPTLVPADGTLYVKRVPYGKLHWG